MIIFLDKETRHFPCHYPHIDSVSCILWGWQNYFSIIVDVLYVGNVDSFLSSFQAVVSKNGPARTGTAKYVSNTVEKNVFRHFQFLLCDKFLEEKIGF